jgi:AmiR/NasT family two-component response regulator
MSHSDSDGDESVVELMGPRELIGQAIDVLIERHELSRDDAFEMLVQRSADSRHKVREVAETICRQRQG